MYIMYTVRDFILECTDILRTEYTVYFFFCFVVCGYNILQPYKRKGVCGVQVYLAIVVHAMVTFLKLSSNYTIQ